MHAELLSDILIVLASAVLVVALFHRLHMPAVIAYMLVGILVGPHALNWLPPSEATRFLAELGVIFLMFYVGLEFSLPHVLAARRAVLIVGGAQVLATAVVLGAAAYAFGLPAPAALLVGGALAMSSTAIGLKQLAEQAELNTAHGRMVVGVLLFQDVATLPFLVALNAFAGAADGLAVALGLALVKAAAVFVVLIVAGRYLLTGAIARVARTRSAELFMLAVLLIVLGTAFIANAVGLSLPLGAFLAGMLIGDTEFKHQVEDDVRPFRDVLMGVFFASIGLQLDPTVLIGHGSTILLLVLALTLIKAPIVMIVGRLARTEPEVAVRAGIILAHGGEFGLLIVALALDRSVLAASAGQPLLAGLILSMALAPVLIRWNNAIARRLLAPQRLASTSAATNPEISDHVVLCGYGRIGRHLARLLEMERVPHLVIELDPARFREAQTSGLQAIYGDATRARILAAAGMTRARALAVTFGPTGPALKLVQHVRALVPDLPIVVSVPTEEGVEEFVAAGASLALPENLEASLVFGSEILLLAGVPPERVRRSIAQLRSDLHPALRSSQGLSSRASDLATSQ